MKKMIYIIKWGGLYQNKGNPGLVFTCNCKMRYYMVFKCIYGLSSTIHIWKNVNPAGKSIDIIQDKVISLVDLSVALRECKLN